jgi:hypothetical protein
MAEFKADVIVLGAGMVGVSAALHLQQRGRDVVLVDKHDLAGEETSYGNAGLIEAASVFPYMFPHDIGQILRYALNRSGDVHYHVSDLPVFLPWLVRYFLASSPAGALRSAMAALPLIKRSLLEHEALIAEAQVPELLRRTGWIKLFRSDATMARSIAELERVRTFGMEGEVLDRKTIAAREPNRPAISPARFIGPRPVSCRIPARSPRPMPRCSIARAGVSSLATPQHSRKVPAAGASPAPPARSPRVKLSSRSDHGRTSCSGRWVIGSRSGSNVVIICISNRAAMPCSTIRFSISTKASCWRR